MKSVSEAEIRCSLYGVVVFLPHFTLWSTGSGSWGADWRTKEYLSGWPWFRQPTAFAKGEEKLRG